MTRPWYAILQVISFAVGCLVCHIFGLFGVVVATVLSVAVLSGIAVGTVIAHWSRQRARLPRARLHIDRQLWRNR